MPRNMRNFWIEAEIDGRATELSGGPQAKDGGFYLKILQRDEGSIAQALVIEGYALENGALHLIVDVAGEDTLVHKTIR